MKWLFLILLVLNLVYLGWELDRQTGIEIRQNRTVSTVPASAERLKLLHEVEVKPEMRRQSSAEEVTTDTEQQRVGLTTMEDLVMELPEILIEDSEGVLPPTSCYRYGPVADEALANELNQWFVSRDISSDVIYTEEQGARLFWVYLAPQGSRENALAVLAEMQGKGIGDYRLINRGDLENAISLGLFSSREAVDSRLRELEEKGYVPVVVPYTEMKKTFWINVQVENDSAVSEQRLDGIPSNYASVPVNCNVDFNDQVTP